MERYLTCEWDLAITKIHITRETEKSYYISLDEAREARRNKDHNFHVTWEAAIAHLVARERLRLDAAKDEAARRERNLATIAALVKPT